MHKRDPNGLRLLFALEWPEAIKSDEKRSTPRHCYKKSPTIAETLDFRARFWKFRGLVLAYSGRSGSFWTAKIDSGWPDGSPCTKRELWSSSGTHFRSFSPEVRTILDVFQFQL